MSAAASANDDLLARGNRALQEGNWTTAQALFTEALEQEEVPEALEGLGDAAFFLDEGDTAVAARENAYRAYRRAGRPLDAARVATALAWDYRVFRGERAVGDGWLARARRLTDGLGPTRERGWVALRQASFCLPADAATAFERCAEAEALGRELDDLDLEMTAIALDGLARVSRGDVLGGMARLDEATTAATAGEMRDPLAIGLSCCYLIFACERVRDLERAGQWCERLAGMASGWNIRALRSVCRAHYGSVLVLRGEWPAAETELTEAVAVLAARPAEGADALARLAELRRRQGRTEEALALIGRTEHHPLAVLCRAAIALERDDATAALDHAARYLRLVGDAKTERAPALELVAEAAAANDDRDGAAAAAAELRTIAELAGTEPLRGAARHAEGCANTAAGDLAAAREAFEDAVALLGRAGLPFEASRARVELGRTLRALGREQAAQEQLGVACKQLVALGAAGAARRATRLRAAARGAEDDVLSPRESEILRLVADGLSNKEIAAELGLSPHTVHRHVANILVKLRLSSRAAAAAYAARQGLID